MKKKKIFKQPTVTIQQAHISLSFTGSVCNKFDMLKFKKENKNEKGFWHMDTVSLPKKKKLIHQHKGLDYY